MNKLPLNTAMIGGLLCVSLAQILSPMAKAQSVAIIQQPNLESAHDDTAILRWTTTTPRGSAEHFAVVQYWHDPQYAESDGEIARQDQLGPLRHDIPCPHRRPAAADDLLLQSDFNRR